MGFRFGPAKTHRSKRAVSMLAFVVELLRAHPKQRAALPDLHAAERDAVAMENTVAVRFVVDATHRGNLLGIAPTGRRVRWGAIDIYRVANGMIVEEWAADDSTAILHQVGAYTPPWLEGSQS